MLRVAIGAAIGGALGALIGPLIGAPWILGGMLEQRLGQSMVMLDEKWWLMATRPLSLFFFVLTALALFGRPLWGLLFRQRAPMKSTGE